MEHFLLSRSFLFCRFSITRRQYIEAKYVQKSFLRPLVPPTQNRPSARSIKRWTVGKSHTDDESTIQSFRLTHRQHSKTQTSLRRTSASATDHSMTGWNVNQYLFEGARHGHLSMMLHAVALGAEINYQHENDQGRTPLIQTVLSVRFAFFFLFDFNKNV